MAKCKSCGAPVSLAPDGDPKFQPVASQEYRLRHAITLMERIYYMEGKSDQWRAAHMNGVARDAQNGASVEWAERLFPRSTQ